MKKYFTILGAALLTALVVHLFVLFVIETCNSEPDVIGVVIMDLTVLLITAIIVGAKLEE